MPLPMKKLDGHRMPQIQGARSKVDEFLAGSSIHGPLPIYAHRTCLEVCAPVRLQTINNDSHISLFDTASKGGKVQAQVFFCNLQHREGYAGLDLSSKDSQFIIFKLSTVLGPLKSPPHPSAQLPS